MNTNQLWQWIYEQGSSPIKYISPQFEGIRLTGCGATYEVKCDADRVLPERLVNDVKVNVYLDLAESLCES